MLLVSSVDNQPPVTGLSQVNWRHVVGIGVVAEAAAHEAAACRTLLLGRRRRRSWSRTCPLGSSRCTCGVCVSVGAQGAPHIRTIARTAAATAGAVGAQHGQRGPGAVVVVKVAVSHFVFGGKMQKTSKN